MFLLSMQQLAEFRIRNDIAMSALAKELDIPRQQLNNIEKGNGKNCYASDEFKEQYLQALYRLIAKRKEKQIENKEAQ